MKEMISGDFTIKIKPFHILNQDRQKTYEEYKVPLQIGEMDIYKNGKAYINLFDESSFAFENFEPSVELFIEKPKSGKTKVFLVYRNGFSVFNGFFSEEEKNQFSIYDIGGCNRLGALETIGINNDISNDGGKLVLRFKATHSCFVNTLGIIEISVNKISPMKKIEKIYS